MVLANYKEDQQRALQQREDRMRSAGDRDEYAPGQFTNEEDEDTTPQDRRSDQREWYTQRWGDLKEHISDELTREVFVTSGYTWQSTEAGRMTGTSTMLRTSAHRAPKLS